MSLSLLEQKVAFQRMPLRSTFRIGAVLAIQTDQTWLSSDLISNKNERSRVRVSGVGELGSRPLWLVPCRLVSDLFPAPRSERTSIARQHRGNIAPLSTNNRGFFLRTEFSSSGERHIMWMLNLSDNGQSKKIEYHHCGSLDKCVRLLVTVT